MQDLIGALDTREEEIHQFLANLREEREKLISRLNELDAQQSSIDADLRRINKARSALRNPDEAEMMAADVASMTVAAPTRPSAYHPTGY